ncbi:MAG: hypothetical protein Q8P68_06235 [Candidatus Peregrinibacteria bacterium]|nr:hypothetical protein [Candidatus Peregrinibacteria bacterium]MDZ4245139.1 hypothetical protein [Candidatus Gracilibacteria bacterium]
MLFNTILAGGSIVEAAQQYDTIEIINKLIAYAILIAGLLCVAFIFFGGLSFILSGGDEGKIKQAVGTIRYSIIGLIITILSVFIVSIVGKAMGLNVIKYINFTDIVETIKGISNDSSSNNSLD